MRRFLFVAVFFFLLITPAVAAADNGSTVINVSACSPSAGTTTTCGTLLLVIHTNSTPSGNTSYQIHERTSHVTTDENGQILEQDNGSEHIRVLTKLGTEQVALQSNPLTSTYLGQTCTLFFRYHLANGAYQYSEFVSTCP